MGVISPIIAFAILLSTCAISQAAQVIAITDGDTLKVLQGRQQIKVRLADIDAPEKRQPFGQRSRQSLSDLCFGKDARLDVRNKDRYGRTVARVYCDGIDANRAQVERGLAWVYTHYNTDPKLPAVEQAARAAGVGLWRDPKPVPPWEWRRAKTKSPGG